MKGVISHAFRDAVGITGPAVQAGTTAADYIQELRERIPNCKQADQAKLITTLPIFERWMEQSGVSGAQINETAIERFRSDLEKGSLLKRNGRKYNSMSRQAPFCVVALHNTGVTESKIILRPLVDARVYPRLKAFLALTPKTQAVLTWFESNGLRAGRKGMVSKRLMTDATRQQAIYAAIQLLREVGKTGLEQVTSDDIRRITPAADPDDEEYRRVSRMLHAAHALYRSCHEHGDLQANPLSGQVDHNTFNAHAIREFIPPSDVVKLRNIGALDTNDPKAFKDKIFIQSFIDRLVTLVFVDTALRRNELASIKLAQVRKDDDGGYVIVLEPQNQKMRDKAGVSIPLLYPETNRMVGIYLAKIRPQFGQDSFIVDSNGMAASGQALAHAVAREAERLDLRRYYSKERPSPHDLRRTFATINASPLGMEIEANDLAARMRDGMEVVYRHYVQNNPLITGMKAEKYRQRAAITSNGTLPTTSAEPRHASGAKNTASEKKVVLPVPALNSMETLREWISEEDALRLLASRWKELPVTRCLRDHMRTRRALRRNGPRGQLSYDANEIRWLIGAYTPVSDLVGPRAKKDFYVRDLVGQDQFFRIGSLKLVRNEVAMTYRDKFLAICKTRITDL